MVISRLLALSEKGGHLAQLMVAIWKCGFSDARFYNLQKNWKSGCSVKSFHFVMFTQNSNLEEELGKFFASQMNLLWDQI